MRILETEKSQRLPFEGGFLPALEWDADEWLGLFDSLPCPVIVYQPDGQLLLANRQAATRFGLEGVFSMPDYLYPLIKNASRLELYDHGREISLNGLDGSGPYPMLLKPLSLRGQSHAIVATGLVKSGVAVEDKAPDMEGLDEGMAMAGEMSQKVRGPLAGIELYASILGEELDGTGESGLTQLIDEIRYSVREVNEYLTSVESMTEPLKLDLEKVNLADAVDEALGALNGLFKARGIGVLVEQKDLVMEMDRSLVTQMFLNILINAAEAMPGGGRLTVRQEVNRAGEAEVIFTDTGPGVSVMDAKKLFNPFYTTKNQPLGLGLPVSQRIAEAHQGRLAIGMDDPLGARVKVVLPYIPVEQAEMGPLN
jgi:signal transduction histidine kinase